MLILDCELFVNYFLLAFKEIETGRIKTFELFENHPLNTKLISGTMQNHTTISFNGLSYDLPIIQAAIEGWDNAALKKMSDNIIKSNLPSWKFCQTNNINVDLGRWNTIDLIDIAPGKTSLKIYGGRLHAPTIQDLPFHQDKVLTLDEMQIVKTYCINDLNTTELLYKTLKPAIELRIAMSNQYGIDLRSKSDAQIAETVIKSELTKITGKKYKPIVVNDDYRIRYQDPGIVAFYSNELNDLFKKIRDHEFEMLGNGSIKIPAFLKENKVKIGKAEYQVGIGGLHSCEKSQFVEADEEFEIVLYDVASYYPNIILQQQLSPKSMGADFLKVYQSIVTRRIEAKKRGDKVISETLKISTNGSFGKLGSKYSPLYAPELLLQVTMTGQLCLLMLIERMDSADIKIISANTDGIFCEVPKHLMHDMEEIIFDWELDTSFTLERTDYKLLASRDVNNYVAVKTDGKLKRKGCFANGGLAKNPDRNIIYTAVGKFLAEGTPIEETIRNCTDVRQFVTVRKVQGGAIFNGKEIGKAVRFYYSTKSTGDDCLHYKLGGNKVPNSTGCQPLMTLCEGMPDDLDYDRYIYDANMLLGDVGYRIDIVAVENSYRGNPKTHKQLRMI